LLHLLSQRFCTALDCVDIGFLPDGTLDQLPLPGQMGASRVGGIDVNKPRIRAVIAAVLALAASPEGFTVADVTARVHAMTGQTLATYNTRQTAYDLRKLRGKQLVSKPPRTRRHYLPGEAARTLLPACQNPAGKGAKRDTVPLDHGPLLQGCKPSACFKGAPPARHARGRCPDTGREREVLEKRCVTEMGTTSTKREPVATDRLQGSGRVAPFGRNP
jgi:hypothetical protein